MDKGPLDEGIEEEAGAVLDAAVPEPVETPELEVLTPPEGVDERLPDEAGEVPDDVDPVPVGPAELVELTPP